MTSKKRKYGDLSARPLPTEDPSLIDDVFAAFTGTRPTSVPVESAEPEMASTPAQRAAPAQKTSPAQRASAAQAHPEPLHDAADAPSATPAQSAVVAGYTRVPNNLLDRILPTLDTYDQTVLIRLYRLSRGFGSDTCRVSAPTLAKACNISERQVRKSVIKLEVRGFVKRIEQDFGNKDKSLRGTIFRMLLSDPIAARATNTAGQTTPAHGTAPARGADNKRKAFKENNYKGDGQKITRLTPEEIQSFTSTVVDLLREGKSAEEIEAQYAPSMHPADWATVKSVALAQVTPKKGK
jgi:DNA-binding Lrp family transcriptional regulator